MTPPHPLQKLHLLCPDGTCGLSLPIIALNPFFLQRQNTILILVKKEQYRLSVFKNVLVHVYLWGIESCF